MLLLVLKVQEKWNANHFMLHTRLHIVAEPLKQSPACMNNCYNKTTRDCGTLGKGILGGTPVANQIVYIIYEQKLTLSPLIVDQ